MLSRSVYVKNDVRVSKYYCTLLYDMCNAHSLISKFILIHTYVHTSAIQELYTVYGLNPS